MSNFASDTAVTCNLNCWGCLAYNDTLRPMEDFEKVWYNFFTSEINTLKTENTMYFCGNCRYIIRKLVKFKNQCQKINNMITEMTQHSKCKPFVSLTVTPIKTMYIGEDLLIKSEVSDDDIDNDDEIINNMMMTINKCDDNDEYDDVPLNILKEEADVRNSEMLNEDTKKKSEKINEESKKVKKQLKNGFSSRMVQETNEYIVIKLTKQQVKEELRTNSQNDKYLRALYKCEKCVKGFNFDDVLQSHLEKHSRKNGEFLCDICELYCPTAVSLRGHMKSHTTRYKCKVCGDVRISRQHLLEHYAISHTAGATEYNCQYCYFTSNKRTVIQRHVRTHTATEKLTCTHCGIAFKNVETLRVHVTRRHNKSKSLECPQCPRKFIYPSLLQKHIQAVHIHKDYYCVECDIRFKSSDNLKLHFKKAKKHRDMSSYNHECPQCCERFVTNSALSSHLTSSHGHPKKYVCEHCSRMYSSRESLRAHMRRVHDDKQPVIHCCEVCKKTFNSKNLLHAHTQTHKTEKCT